MKQIYYTGRLVSKVEIVDGEITDKIRPYLTDDDILYIKSNQDKRILFRRYDRLS
jgi:hypothetical protein